MAFTPLAMQTDGPIIVSTVEATDTPEKEKTMRAFHGTDREFDPAQPNPTNNEFDLCVTPDREVAADFGETVHEVHVDIPEEKVATPEQVNELVDFDVNTDPMEFGPCFVSDRVKGPKIRQAVRDAGFAAIRHTDVVWGVGEFECIRVFEPGHVT